VRRKFFRIKPLAGAAEEGAAWRGEGVSFFDRDCAIS
jgi:hypothetical protein